MFVNIKLVSLLLAATAPTVLGQIDVLGFADSSASASGASLAVASAKSQPSKSGKLTDASAPSNLHSYLFDFASSCLCLCPGG
jgi:hypothetical protein